MKLESISIVRFRSIEKAELTGCGPFNVLIGKNNCGKSNILSAIQAFFGCIQGATLVNIDPPAGKDLDFFSRTRNSDVTISTSFILELAERDALLRNIVAEASQMRNAVDGIDPVLRLIITVRITGKEPSISYISTVLLKPYSVGESPQTSSDRTLLDMNEGAAREIHDQKLIARQETETHKQLLALSKWVKSGRTRDARHLGIQDESGAFPVRFLPQIVEGFGEAGMSRLAGRTGNSITHAELERIVDETLAAGRESLAKEQPIPLKNKIDTFAGEQATIPHYVLDLLNQVSQLKVLHLPERRMPIGRREAEQLLNLKVERGGPQILRNIQESVMALLGVQIDAFKSRTARRGEEASAEIDIDDFLAEANGSGIREALRVILDVEFGRPAILLVEEPEIHLHPALETSLMRFLKRISRECQVFITTHSTNFLDTAEMKNVILVSKTSSTKVQQLSLDEAEAAIPKELGIRLSSLFMFDRLVFVEGPSDEAVLREWASILGVNLNQANVGFVPMGSVRNFAHFAAESTLTFLTKRQVKMWFLIDRDEKDDADIANLKAKLGDRAVLEVLAKREIENYLIQSRAIVEFILLKQQLGSRQGLPANLTETAISQVIEETAETLKVFAIEKRVDKLLCKPVFPSSKRAFGVSAGAPDETKVSAEIDRMIQRLNDAKGTITETVKQQTQIVESMWKANKLDIVPGDHLLDEVCQKYGTRFNKERDSSRLASLMNADEIDSNMRRIIKDIGSSDIQI